MEILGTGLSGLVGSRVVELLNKRYEFEASDVDIADRQKIIDKIKSSDASIILHLAAKTDVDGCEKDKEEDQKLLNRHSGERSDSRISFAQSNERFWTSQNDEEWNGKKTAWGINVIGTKNVADACQESNKKLIYISTDFVFDGEKTSRYIEEDTPNPINWYGKTKYEGEKFVQSMHTPWVIVRIAYPYRANFVRNDFLRAILRRLQGHGPVAAVTDHIFTPTFVDDIAFAIDTLISKEAPGIFHLVGSQSLSPYDATVIIAKMFGFDRVRRGFGQKEIQKTTRSEFFLNRAPRPFHLALKNDKIQKLGVKMKTFEEGILEVKRQMDRLQFSI